MNNSISPKKRFLLSPDAKVHADIVLKESFLNACTIALAEMQMNMPESGDPSKSWDSHCQMVGARKYLSYLLNLSEAPDPLERIPVRGLNYDPEPKPKQKQP